MHAKTVRRIRRGIVQRRLIGSRGRRDVDSWIVEATIIKAMVKRKTEG